MDIAATRRRRTFAAAVRSGYFLYALHTRDAERVRCIHRQPHFPDGAAYASRIRLTQNPTKSREFSYNFIPPAENHSRR